MGMIPNAEHIFLSEGRVRGSCTPPRQPLSPSALSAHRAGLPGPLARVLPPPPPQPFLFHGFLVFLEHSWWGEECEQWGLVLKPTLPLVTAEGDIWNL